MKRETRETRVEVVWNRDGGEIAVTTGVGFLDHMLEQWAFHGGFGLRLTTEGDLRVDTHHTVEDTALALGAAVGESLGDRSGLSRFGCAYAPLDEALSRVVVDLVRRPYAAFRCATLPPMLGVLPSEMVCHFFASFASAASLTLHVDVLAGENGHHKVESAFKAFGLAMAAAVAPARRDGAPSTKGLV
jgi:imidazoleglycerol-phosphate dehydratase